MNLIWCFRASCQEGCCSTTSTASTAHSCDTKHLSSQLGLQFTCNEVAQSPQASFHLDQKSETSPILLEIFASGPSYQFHICFLRGKGTSHKHDSEQATHPVAVTSCFQGCQLGLGTSTLYSEGTQQNSTRKKKGRAAKLLGTRGSSPTSFTLTVRLLPLAPSLPSKLGRARNDTGLT